MIEDKNKIVKLLLTQLKIIISEFDNIKPELINYLLTSNIVEFSDNNTISFFVKDGVLYLPKEIYSVLPKLKDHELYGVSPHDCRRIDEYLDTDTTYYDYIEHVIKAGLTPYQFFEESLLHEAMHLCGSGGGNPLDEGINELKTREIAQKHKIRIAAYGYPKEVEIAKELQEILGKNIMDQLAFMKPFDRYDFLIQNVGIEKANLYKKIFKDMVILSNNYYNKMKTISDPYEKAAEYKKINYTTIFDYIDDYVEKTK